MSQSTPSTSAPARRPTLGLVAQVAGVLGLIVCVLAIVGVLAGRSFVQDRVDVLSNGAVKALDQAIAVSDTALTGLASGAADAAEVRTSADALAKSPTIDELAFAALQARLAPLAQRYQDFRDRYVVLREKATGLMDTVQRLDRLLPGVKLPGGPAELVAGMDEKLTALDQAITDVSANAASRSAASETAAAIAGAAGRLGDGIAAATESAQGIQDGLVNLQDDVSGVSDKVASLVGLGSAALIILFIWVGLLNVALWALGRRWRAA